MKEVRIDLTDEEYQLALKAKKRRTWREVILKEEVKDATTYDKCTPLNPLSEDVTGKTPLIKLLKYYNKQGHK